MEPILSESLSRYYRSKAFAKHAALSCSTQINDGLSQSTAAKPTSQRTCLATDKSGQKSCCRKNAGGRRMSRRAYTASKQQPHLTSVPFPSLPPSKPQLRHLPALRRPPTFQNATVPLRGSYAADSFSFGEATLLDTFLCAAAARRHRPSESRFQVTQARAC